MKRLSLLVAVIALLLSGVIYVLYRSEHTCINVLLSGWVPGPLLQNLRQLAMEWLPLSDAIVWRLPAGLWVFAASLITRDFPPLPGLLKVPLDWTPAAAAVALEFAQYFHVTDGAFDPWDIAAAIAGRVVVGFAPCRRELEPFQSAGRWNWALYLGSFAILVFADVRP